MGERGPLPAPYVRRRNKRPTLAKTVVSRRPSAPRNLKGEARAEWNRIVPELEAIGIVATIDRAALVRYCTAWAEWCDLNAKIAGIGLLIAGRRDGVVRNPLCLLRSDAERALSDLGRELGLTPTARLRAGLKHEAPKVNEQPASITAIEDYRKMVSE